MKRALCCLFFVLFAPAALPFDLQEDLRQLQGTWTSNLLNEQFGTVPATLVVDGNIATLSATTTTGEVIFRFRTEFRLEQFGPFRALTYFNAESLHGATAGQKFLTGEETRSSVYTLAGEILNTANGFGANDENPPAVIQWRKKATPPPPDVEPAVPAPGTQPPAPPAPPQRPARPRQP